MTIEMRFHLLGLERSFQTGWQPPAQRALVTVVVKANHMGPKRMIGHLHRRMPGSPRLHSSRRAP
jgi:hypothetical protein